MSDWGLAADFDIDDGSLDDLTDHQIFVLGVEWGMLYQQLESDVQLVLARVHTENAERLMRMCRRLGREPLATSIGDGWVEIRFMSNKEVREALQDNDNEGE